MPSIKKVITAAIGVALVMLFIYLLVFGRALYQQENHLGIALALPKTIFNSRAVRVDNQTCLAKNSSSFIATMEQQEFTYIEQLGAGYFFEKDGANYISTSRMYSSHFMLFAYPVKN